MPAAYANIAIAGCCGLGQQIVILNQPGASERRDQQMDQTHTFPHDRAGLRNRCRLS
jgi:hypothetical protein